MENTQRPENGFMNLGINILIPVLVLNKLSTKLGPLNALLLALAFPLCYGAWDFAQKKKLNFFAAFGILNTLVTGGLAVLMMGGIWFSVKEAFFPFLIGIFVFFSASTTKPFIKTFFLNPALFNIPLIEGNLKATAKETEFDHHVRLSTKFLAASFFLSALLNFILAQTIFTEIDPAIPEIQRSVLLNEQIADMTWKSAIVIMVPSMIVLSLILWHLMSGIQKLTGLKLEEILKN